MTGSPMAGRPVEVRVARGRPVETRVARGRRAQVRVTRGWPVYDRVARGRTAGGGQGCPWTAGRFGPGSRVDGGQMTGSPVDGRWRPGSPLAGRFKRLYLGDDGTYSAHILRGTHGDT